MPAIPFVGQIMPVAFRTIPKGWALCNGAILPIATNQALFNLIGITYGGDGRSTFALPDLRGRAVLGCNFASVPWGQVAGSETVTVSTGQLPGHNHSIQATTQAGTGRNAPPTNNLFATTTATPIENIFAMAGSREIALSTGTNVTNSGGGTAHNNMQPSLVVGYMIALTGIYPSRS